MPPSLGASKTQTIAAQDALARHPCKGALFISISHLPDCILKSGLMQQNHIWSIDTMRYYMKMTLFELIMIVCIILISIAIGCLVCSG